MWPLIPLFWTSGDVCPGFQSQGGFPQLCASSPAHNIFLRFTSGVTPADCIEVRTLIHVRQKWQYHFLLNITLVRATLNHIFVNLIAYTKTWSNLVNHFKWWFERGIRNIMYDWAPLQLHWFRSKMTGNSTVQKGMLQFLSFFKLEWLKSRTESLQKQSQFRIRPWVCGAVNITSEIVPQSVVFQSLTLSYY